MDFDEYDYLEKTVETADLPKDRATRSDVDENHKYSGEERTNSSKHLSHVNDDDSGLASKRSKSTEQLSEDYHLRNERSSSHRRSHSRDVERDEHRSKRVHRERDRDRSESNGKEKDRARDRESREHSCDDEKEHGHNRERRERESEKGKERDRGRESDRSQRSRSHSERERESEREKEKDRERESERSRRSRSHSVRHRSELDEKYREKSPERELRERESRRYREKKEEMAEPEADPERDQRTVFAYQISLKADERDVFEFFSRAGKVRDVRLIMDRNSRRSKGVGYIEFYDVMSVPMAIALSGQPLLGQAVMVKPSEAEKNLVQSTTGGAGGVSGPFSGGARRLYVGNLHFSMTEEQLRQVFEPFGTVELVQLPLDETGHCKGFGFIQFARLEEAKAAQSLNGQLEIAGRIIKVSTVTDNSGTQDASANAADFDDDEGGGLALTAQSRAMLMQKLDRSGIASNIANSLSGPAIVAPCLAVPTASVLGTAATAPSLVSPLIQPSITALAKGVPPATIPAVDTIGVPSECLLLKNMFDPNVETEPDFEIYIKEEVEDECSKFGKLKHIYVDKHSAGFVYVRFESAQAASSAQRALHGRWFSMKMITATFVVPQDYEAKFPGSG